MKLFTFFFFFFSAIVLTGQPASPAPTPTQSSEDVISLFSNAYENVAVDTWRTDWSAADFQDIEIAGNPTKLYTNLDFVGIETVASQIDVSGMTHFRIDVWSPNFTFFGIKLVDFGPDGAFGGGDDTEHQVNIEMPAQGEWVSLDIPLSDFVELQNRQNIAQLILVGQPTGMSTVYVDNIFFYASEGGAQEPLVAAPAPTQDASNVISMFSDAYEDVAVDTWRTDWSAADFEDIEVAGNPTKLYTNLDFVGIETVANQIDISGMTHFRMDIWSPNFTFFGIKLVDFGPDGSFGGGDDTEHQINIEMPGQARWVSLDIPISDFIDLQNRQNIAQLILVGQPTGMSTVYIDNIYFYASDGGPQEPVVAAPAPTQNASDVISLFSDVYEDVPVDTWRTDWSAAELEDIEVDGNPTKLYTNLDFVGIETVANQIDVSEMTHFRMDVWSPNFTLLGIKIVDFGPDGAFGGDDDTEHQVNIEMPAQGEWVSLDIPLTDFVELQNRQNIAQLILVGQPTGMSTVYVDNVYFYASDGGPLEPLTGAPVPTQNASDVISLFSDEYEDVSVDTWRTDWSAAEFEDVLVDGNPTKLYTDLDFVGIETVANQIDITGMTHFRMDVWSPDFTFFGIKLVDFGPDGAFGGGDDTEHQVNFEMPLQGEWVSLDIPLSDFMDLQNRQNIAQLILVGQPVRASKVYVDNVFFYSDTNVSTNEQTLINESIQVFPNPVNVGAEVQLSKPIRSITIYDMTGRFVTSSNQSSINTSGLVPGTYFLQIRTLHDKVAFKRLIIK